MNDLAATSLDRSFVDRFVDRMLAVWNAHDTTDLPNLVTDDLVWRDPALVEPARGIESVRRFLEQSFRAFPDLRFELTGSRCVADDTPVLMVPWRMTGTNDGPIDPPGYPATGRIIDVRGVDIYTFRDGRVAEYRACYDTADVSRQLGLLPARGSRAERMFVATRRLRSRLRFGARALTLTNRLDARDGGRPRVR